MYRDGNKIAAQIGPDWVQGIAGFGDTVADALPDLAQWFDRYGYELRGNSAGIERIEEGGYRESDFPEPVEVARE